MIFKMIIFATGGMSFWLGVGRCDNLVDRRWDFLLVGRCDDLVVGRCDVLLIGRCDDLEVGRCDVLLVGSVMILCLEGGMSFWLGVVMILWKV